MDNLGTNSGEPGKTSPWSLYVHIPFCEYRCRYCDFYFETTRSHSLQVKLVDRILEEALALGQSGGPIFSTPPETLYLGGGTPSALEPELLDRLLQGFKSLRLSPRSEGTIEANPEGITPRFLEILGSGGIDRLSVGVQSLDDSVLHTLGRRAYSSRTLESLDLVSQGWKGRWNLDVMTGLPGQDWPGLKNTLDRLLAFNPDHVSLYSLTLEPGTALASLVKRKQVILPGEVPSEDLWLRARDNLMDRGYKWYEISNFAKPGCESRHNQVYWRLDPYAGIGPGAQGTIPDPLTGNPVRTSNPKLFDYLSGGLQEKEFLNSQEYFLEHLLTGLRTTEGLSWKRIQDRFGFDLKTAWKTHWPELAERGWTVKGSHSGESFVLTDSGRLVLDRVLFHLLPWTDELKPLFRFA